ncbi:MAG: mechanosensitive ion channel, partial [Ignavibacteriaceae bacterium]|nr:mechanosensitive ion channel [Ignavibacteriaceae bacterium]
MFNKFLSFLKFYVISFLLVTTIKAQEIPQKTPAQLPNLSGYPVVLDKDTLFHIYNGIGPFSAEKRAGEISIGLKNLVEKDSLNVDSLSLEMQNGMALIRDNNTIIMAITPADTLSNGKSLEILSGEYFELIKEKVEATKSIYSQKTIIEKLIYISIFFVGFILLMWINRLVFPRIYAALEKLEGKVFKSFSIKKFEILKGTDLIDITTIIMKGLRLLITLAAIYSLLVFTVTNLPWTRHWYIQPILRGILLFIFVTVVASVLIKGVNVSYRYFTIKYRSWKGTLIKSFKVKSVEILSEDKAVDMLDFATKVIRILLWLIIGYFYITLVFSFFEFSRTWASELIYYILNPLNTVVMSIINFLPNLFFIIVIITVFNYLIKFVKYFFNEVEKENIKLPGFHVDWVPSTYKIVRFLIIVLAIIIIFPYLPGSDSEAFKGISVFLGILFSLGSTSAISNIVAGTVLTNMRPFRLGDRVKKA